MMMQAPTPLGPREWHWQLRLWPPPLCQPLAKRRGGQQEQLIRNGFIKIGGRQEHIKYVCMSMCAGEMFDISYTQVQSTLLISFEYTRHYLEEFRLTTVAHNFLTCLLYLNVYPWALAWS